MSKAKEKEIIYTIGIDVVDGKHGVRVASFEKGTGKLVKTEFNICDRNSKAGALLELEDYFHKTGIITLGPED